MELPFIKFYGRDWLGDSQLRLCSLAARGLWIDMVALMAASQRRGFLEIGGKPIKDAITLARIVSADSSEVEKLLHELKDAAVYSRDENGTIYSRRMVRDTAISEQKRLAGLQGGNPTLVKHEDKPLVKHEDKPLVKHEDKPLVKPRDQRPETTDKAYSTKAKKLPDEKKYLADLIESLLAGEWVNDAGKWINRIKNNFKKSERVIGELKVMVAENKIKTTPAACAEQIWKEFA